MGKEVKGIHPKQGKLFNPSKVNSQQFNPVTEITEGAKRYAESMGTTWEPPHRQQQADHLRGYLTNSAYRKSMDSPAPDSEAIRNSYAVATDHINRQYDYATRPKEQGGMGIKHVVSEDGYGEDAKAAEPAMANDVAQNKRLITYPTSVTAGSDSGQAPTNQAFDNETNDKFRFVHDLFGHAGIGRGFSRHGEEAAFISHARMFPPEAHAALASELRGQNAFLNYGKESPSEFPDPGSKMVELPKWAEKEGKLPRSVTHPKQPKASKKDRGEQLSLDL